MSKVNQYILTFEAIGAVRGELAQCESVGDTAGAADAYGRLVGLYASIDANSIIATMKQLSGENVVSVDFQAKRKAA